MATTLCGRPVVFSLHSSVEPLLTRCLQALKTVKKESLFGSLSFDGWVNGSQLESQLVLELVSVELLLLAVVNEFVNSCSQLSFNFFTLFGRRRHLLDFFPLHKLISNLLCRTKIHFNCVSNHQLFYKKLFLSNSLLCTAFIKCYKQYNNKYYKFWNNCLSNLYIIW